MADWDLPRDLDLDRLVPRSSSHFPRQVFRSVRLVTRLIETLTVIHNGYPKPLVLAAVCCAALDLRLGSYSGRSRPRRLAFRLLLDTVDVALWSIALHGAADVAAVVATPLAFEVGLWYGRWFALAPAVVGTATMITLRLAGYPPAPLVYLWPAVWAAAGVLMALVLRARWRGEARSARDAIEAAVGQAELSGQNSVAMGADSVVDLLIRTNPLIAAYEAAPRPSPFSGWKAELAEACSRQATYLGVALTRWQRLYNSRSPDLSADVELEVASRAGTLLLSPGQAQRLQEMLEGLAPRGTVRVDVPRQGPVGAEQTVMVGAARLVIPADRAPRPRPLQIAPFALGAGAILTLVQSLPQWEAAPLWTTVPLALVLTVGCWLCLARPGQDPMRMARRLVVAGLAIGAADAVLTSAFMRPDSGRLPFLFFLQWFGPLFVAHVADLPRWQRGLVPVGAVAAVAAGMLAMPRDFTLIAVLMAVPWLANPIFMVMGLRRLMAADSSDLRAEMERVHNGAVKEGFSRGRRLVVRLTTEAVQQLRDRYGGVRESLPADIAAEIERRLDEVGALLAALGTD
ncbi:hypothetical protein [Actinoallomurus rhizosphaericola]|uniref:hypothetical protein n=1 Tax=Actinoallomurus rhizosphaericola TaxID=2952536 RepID=UPI0020924718|nr:hypothetical protein [Actinoallomurus rhizosphaericola]MCO5995337.1 hypothetical protein [Actinoallomurus rhizosphaericola]